MKMSSIKRSGVSAGSPDEPACGLEALVWGEEPRPCYRCRVALTEGWLIDATTKMVACYACYTIRGN